MNAESIIEELENICYNNEYILELLSKLKNSIPVRPLPCVCDEHGEIKEQTIKELMAKIHEELMEFESVVFYTCDIDEIAKDADIGSEFLRRISEEAADLKTAVTTFEEAVLINNHMRDEAQLRVNEKNHSRGRL